MGVENGRKYIICSILLETRFYNYISHGYQRTLYLYSNIRVLSAPYSAQLAFLFGTQEPGYFSYKDNNSWDSKLKIFVVIQSTHFSVNP
jgi:hypothetical protein